MSHYSTHPAATATTPGRTVSAVNALNRAQTFTRGQVAYLMQLAYLSGADAHTRADIAEMLALADEHPDPRTIREGRVAARRDAMTAAATRTHQDRPPSRFWPAQHPGGWPLPPDLPSSDPADWWPEDDGWPCPPPHLRGPVT